MILLHSQKYKEIDEKVKIEEFSKYYTRPRCLQLSLQKRHTKNVFGREHAYKAALYPLQSKALYGLYKLYKGLQNFVTYFATLSGM